MKKYFEVIKIKRKIRELENTQKAILLGILNGTFKMYSVSVLSKWKETNDSIQELKQKLDKESK